MRANITLIVIFVLGARAEAGELRLENGARIPGELVEISARKLVWQADLIGRIEIDKEHVAALDSARRIDLGIGGRGGMRDCQVRGEASAASIQCADEPAFSAPLAALDRRRPDWEGSGKLTAALTLDRGNSSKDELEIDVKTDWTRRARRHTLEASVDYEEKGSVTVNDEAELSYQADFLRENGWYYYLKLEYERDRQSALQESRLLGPGVGRELSLGKDLKIRLQGGIDEFWFDLADYGRFRGEGGNLQWRLNWDTGLWQIDFFHEGEYKWAFEDAGVHRLDTRTGITIPLIHQLIAELSLEYDRSGVSKGDTEPDDYEWEMRLGYRW